MKIKKLLLSFILMMSMLCAVACKDKGDPEVPETPQTPAVTKTDPNISVSVENRVYLVGETLGDIELIVASGSTSGTVKWSNEDYVLVQGENVCEWSFTPTDDETYNSKTDTVKINAIKLEIPTVSVNVKAGQTVYVDARYETVELEAVATFGGESVTGQIVWVTPNETFVEGLNSCEWKFIPDEETTYAVVTGFVELEASVEQEPVAISIGDNAKTSYVAFDQIDKSAMTICLVYNGGKVEEISDKQNVVVTYNEGDSLRRGDTSATLSYNGFTTQVTGLSVDYKEIENPTFSEIVVYSGNQKTLTLAYDANAHLYTFTPLQETNADVYDLVVTLIDDENYIWANGDETTTIVKCEILKADSVVDETNCSDEYDGEEHFALVENATDDDGVYSPDIYYSLSEIDDTNYGSASPEPIKKTDAGTYVVYYYMEGDSNHNSSKGSLTIEISKQTPIMNLEYCYSLVTGNVVNYPTSYVSIVDKQSNDVELGTLEFVYYTNYTDDSNDENDTKTTTSDGATSVGGAPKNSNTSEYYVVVKFAGSANYNAVENYTVLYIDGNELDFYAKSDENKFAFKYDENEFYGYEKDLTSTVLKNNGSNSECNAYLEFSELEVNDDGLKIVKFDSKFGEGTLNIRTGRLVYFDGKYQLLDTNGLFYPFIYNSSNEELTMLDGVINQVTMIKWELPNYLKTFAAQTVEDADYNAEKNTNKDTLITIYNDYGTIRFSAKVNLKYSIESSVIGGTTEFGGYQEWSGVAVIGYTQYGDNPEKPLENQRPYFALTCYIVNNNSLENTGYPVINSSNFSFRLDWLISSYTGENEPSSVNLLIGTKITTSPQTLLDGQKYTEVVED